MTIQQCKYVLEIARLGSFNEAAKQLFVAQSGLSSSIKQLEGELGIRIFDRSKSGVCLSPDGAEFVRYAEQIVKQNDFIVDRYSRGEKESKLYICTQHYDFVVDIFCKLLSETKEEKFDFSIREIQTYEVIRAVETSLCDIGIIAIKDNDLDIMNRYLLSKGVSFTQLLTASPHVFVRRAHPLAEQAMISYDSLAPYPYLAYEQGSHNSSFFTEELISDLKAAKRVIISDRATLMNALLTTDSYTVGTGIMPSALNSGKIVGIPIDTESYYRIGYLRRKEAVPTPLTSSFVALLDSFAAEYSTAAK